MMFTDGTGVGMGVSDRPSLFDAIDARYMRAASCRVRKIVLDHPLISDIAGRSAHIFSLLDREDDHQRRLARGVWLLKSTIMQTLLPFDDARLGIASMTDTLKIEAESVPSAIGAVIAFAELVTSLLASSINPKREILLKNLSPLAGSEGGVAVFAGLQGGLNRPGN
jgi:ATP-dependent protease HslVU (ClpYQ) peptidase subunit